MATTNRNSSNAWLKEIYRSLNSVEIDSLMVLILGKKETKGISRTNDHLKFRVQIAQNYSRAYSDGVYQQKLAKDSAKRKVEKIGREVNQFISEKWKNYEKKVTPLIKPMFPAIETIDLQNL